MEVDKYILPDEIWSLVLSHGLHTSLGSTSRRFRKLSLDAPGSVLISDFKFVEDMISNRVVKNLEGKHIPISNRTAFFEDMFGISLSTDEWVLGFTDFRFKYLTEELICAATEVYVSSIYVYAYLFLMGTPVTSYLEPDCSIVYWPSRDHKHFQHRYVIPYKNRRNFLNSKKFV